MLETKFRPIPITILDFLGILVPGFLWLVLMVMTYDAATALKPHSIVGAWKELEMVTSSGSGWMGPLSIIIAALMIGFSVKPLAMPLAGLISRPLFRIMPETRKAPWRKMTFPFQCHFKSTSYYHKACSILSSLTGMPSAEEFPRTGPFAGAKRYLRAAAPALWEESERMEAEVRMAGSLLLAALYSVLLNLVLRFKGLQSGGIWAIFSLIFALVLCFGFNRLRLREVSYTYLNVLLTAGLQSRGLDLARREAKKDEDE